METLLIDEIVYKRQMSTERWVDDQIQQQEHGRENFGFHYTSM
jgi:hypothetical protein